MLLNIALVSTIHLVGCNNNINVYKNSFIAFFNSCVMHITPKFSYAKFNFYIATKFSLN
jgi:hypothetical protein